MRKYNVTGGGRRGAPKGTTFTMSSGRKSAKNKRGGKKGTTAHDGA